LNEKIGKIQADSAPQSRCGIANAPAGVTRLPEL